MSSKAKLELLLNPYYGEYYNPVHWEDYGKSRSYFSIISKGRNSMFNRKFLRSHEIDSSIVFNESDFPEGDILEQSCVYVKGTKQEKVFHGFFIIHKKVDGIFGERITQRDALEFFDLKEQLPTIDDDHSIRNSLKMKIGSVVQKLSQKYGEKIIAEILIDILDGYFPKVLQDEISTELN